MKSFIIFCTILISFLPNLSFAQKIDTTKDTFISAFSFSFEYAGLHLTGLNNQLSKSGIPDAKNPFFGFVSFMGFPATPAQHFFFGWQIGGGHTKNENANYSTELDLFLAALNFYYTIWHSKKSMLYPGLSFCYMQYSLLLKNKSAIPSTFEGALNNIGDETRFKTNNFALNFSLTYQWEAFRDISLEAFAGYRLGLNNPHLKLEDGNDLAGAPSTSGSGFHAGVGIIFQ